MSGRVVGAADAIPHHVRDDGRPVIGTATVDQPKGSFDGLERSFTVYANDQITSADILAMTGQPDATNSGRIVG